mmetsp:Transcript_1038/g.1302  ORF Transcript_1038/g.1302 Transcript_1038/m.1302 type:complete len:152 (-) Transcript_1038:778-1233(-)|eukprot:CAMPEP_0194133760 /NCGR_PEP_ID=MMETSP0152-20130528/3791_1 /TAXON_ID=1049557 /ORGANISM="Thalassiothrix antarctica, Strain L6-D1" /LENGTH=151 /DNA_ID=CAMNT_0038829113 /DNA_START=64 /DNA_END=519 /DNA_ORIENTATION=-
MVTTQQQQNNIFLTYENLAFSLPLLFVCTSYAYFKFIPLYIGLPILGLIGVFFQLKSTLRKHKEKKLQNLDEDFVRELAGDPDEADKIKAAEIAAKTRKAKVKLEQRLAQERKVKAKQQDAKKKKNSSKVADDDDDEYETFAKGSRKKKSK